MIMSRKASATGMSVDRYWEYVELGLANVIQTVSPSSEIRILLNGVGKIR